MKIRNIIPLVTKDFNQAAIDEVEPVRAPDCEVSYVNITKGAQTITSRYEESLDTPEIIRLAREAEAEGVDGVFINCFGEPAVAMARELLDIPVVGGFDSAVLVASLISRRFSIVTVAASAVPLCRSLARELGMTKNLVSIRDVGIPVLELGDHKKLLDSLVEQSTLCIKNDGAESIVLGCTGMVGVAADLQNKLEEAGLAAPVISPTTAAITMLQALIRNGLSQSRLTYYKSSPTLV